MPEPLRFVMFGAGFWARYQLAAWGEQAGVQCVAICDPDREKAESLSALYSPPNPPIMGGEKAPPAPNNGGVVPAALSNSPHYWGAGGPTPAPNVYTDAAAMLDAERPDFADIVTPVGTHAPLVRLCAAKSVPVICQKPLAPTLPEAEALVAECSSVGVPLLVHENWRWQAPLRAAGELLKSGRIGTPFRARLSFVCSFPVFDNQPFLATLPQFILTDIGSHVLDAARFLFGEASSLYATTRKVNPVIQGEDVATVMLTMGDAQTTVVCEMSYASRTEYERFPQTYLFVEGDNGSLEIGPDYLVRMTEKSKGSWQATVTEIMRVPPPRYAWADPVYDLVQASMVPCQANLLAHLRGEGSAETTGADNVETARLVFAAYDSARVGEKVTV